MTAYASLLNIDLNLPERLIAFVAFPNPDQQLDFEADAMRFIVEKDTSSFLEKIFERSNYVFESFNEEDVEGYIQAAISVLYTTALPDGDSSIIKKCIDMIIKSITNSTDHSRSRLKALLALFNLVIEIDIKYETLQALLSFAIATKTSKLISHFHTRVDEWITSWSLNTLQKRQLYYTFSELLSDTDASAKSSLSLIYLIKYFDTFSGEKYPSDVEAIAVKAILSAIKSPVSSFTDRTALLESFRKQNVGGDLGLLIRLLDIICTGKLQNFQEFEGSNGYFMSRYDISPQSIRYNIRLMTLCALGCEKTNLTYSEIASALNVSENDVEDWIVDAVGQGLLQGQMDELTSTVCITRSAHRSFGQPQWLNLQEKLKAVRGKVASVLEAVKKHSA